jgi:hypothetical protein
MTYFLVIFNIIIFLKYSLIKTQDNLNSTVNEFCTLTGSPPKKVNIKFNFLKLNILIFNFMNISFLK